MLCIGSPADNRYQDVRSSLKDAFAFEEWQASMEYLGAEIETLPDGAIQYHQRKYISRLHPVSLERDCAADPSSPVTERERTKLRPSLVGCSGRRLKPRPTSNPTRPKAQISTIQAANKALRFAKENIDVGLQYQYFLGEFDDLVIGYSDASFACREDLSSQGGYLITLSHRDAVPLLRSVMPQQMSLPSARLRPQAPFSWHPL